MDAAGSSPPPPLRIVIVPWLAFGHMLPYLELAERLATRGHSVSYVSTPRNVARLPRLRPAAAPRVDLVALPLPRVEGLPDGAESTNDVPDDEREPLWKAFDGLAAPFAAFLAAACARDDTRPHWVLADCFHHWAVDAALDHKVPCAMFLPTAAVIATMPQRQPDHAASGPAEDAVPSHEMDAMAPLLSDKGVSGMSVSQRYISTQERCVLGVIRSCPEWEPESYPLAATILGMPVVPLGLLPPSPDGGRRAPNGDEHATVRWLDAQPPNSVVYVALGSEVPLPVGHVHELALGLELAGRASSGP